MQCDAGEVSPSSSICNNAFSGSLVQNIRTQNLLLLFTSKILFTKKKSWETCNTHLKKNWLFIF